jgi:hypothetical protein
MLAGTVIDPRLDVHAPFRVHGRRIVVVVMMLDDALALHNARRRWPLDNHVALAIDGSVQVSAERGRG